MRIGQVFAIVGALFVFMGVGVFNPMFFDAFDGNVIPMYEMTLAGKFQSGTVLSLPYVLSLLLPAGLAGLAAFAAFFVRVKKRLAVTNLILSLVIFAGMVHIHMSPAEMADGTAFYSVVEFLRGFLAEPILKGETISIVEGAWFCYFGAMFIMAGSLIVFSSRRVYHPADRFLRVVTLWNGAIERDEVLFEPKNVTIGEGKGNDFVLPTASAAQLPQQFKLFRKDLQGRYEMALLPGMQGEIKLKDEKKAISDYLAKQAGGAQWVPIVAGDWGIVNVGECSVFFQFVPPERGIKRKGVAAFEWDMAGALGISAVVQVGLILLSLFTWQEVAVRSVSDFSACEWELNPQEVTLDSPDMEPPPELAEATEPTDIDPTEIDDTHDAPVVESDDANVDDSMKKDIDVRKTGLLDTLSRGAGNGALSSIMGSAAGDLGNKLAVAMDGTGAEYLMGSGAGGLGFAGTGTGAGGAGGYGKIHGLGRISTGGGGMGVRAGSGRKQARKVGKLKFGGGGTQGFCSRGDIAKQVRLRAGAIRACYERALQVKPSLAGKITIKWTIKLDGTVTGAGVVSSSMKNSAVEGCILRAIRRIRFKKPKGGICIVKWPFVFNPG